MELKLNVYKGSKIEKTYTAETFRLSTGICEDILQLVDIDKLLSGDLKDKDFQNVLGFELLKIVTKSFSSFKELLKDIFDGLTDEEIRNTPIDEVGKIVFQIVLHTVNKLYSVGGATKN